MRTEVDFYEIVTGVQNFLNSHLTRENLDEFSTVGSVVRRFLEFRNVYLRETSQTALMITLQFLSESVPYYRRYFNRFFNSVTAPQTW